MNLLKNIYWIIKNCTTARFDGLLASNFKEHTKCVSLSNGLCRASPRRVNINSNEILLY